MKLVSKIEIKTSATNIKELYIGFSKDNILHLIQLFKASYDADYYIGELYFNYKQNYSIYFRLLQRIILEKILFQIENHKNVKQKHMNYQSVYKIEIDEKKVRLDDDDYLYEYKIIKNLY